MGEPLARMDMAADGLMAHAAERLERAVLALEAAIGRPPAAGAASAEPFPQVVDLRAARRRARELEGAATQASQALGRAMAEVRQALDQDAETAGDRQTSLFDQGLFDQGLLESTLESEVGLPDEEGTEADERPSGKEPAA